MLAALIEDYALIGDCETAALVSRDGSIDWLCFPRFDSPACFAALLGTPENGRWRIAPSAAMRSVTRRYRRDTLILETDFRDRRGHRHADRLHAAARRRHRSRAHRRAACSGTVALRHRSRRPLRLRRAPCPGSRSWRTARHRAIAGPDRLVLRTRRAAAKAQDLQHASATFTVAAARASPSSLT